MPDAPTLSLALRLADGDVAELSSLAQRKAEVDTVLSGERPPYGRLTLHSSAGPELRFGDDLLPMADALAGLLPKLRRGDGGQLAGYSQPFMWTFTRDGDRLRIVDADGASRDDDATMLTGEIERVTAELIGLLRGGSLQEPSAGAVLDLIEKHLAS